MMFHVYLQTRQSDTPNSPESLLYGPYDEDQDDVHSIIADICDKLEDLGVANFSVGGFGQAEWPVDVRYDLLTFVEQIGNVLTSIRRGSSTDLVFPEQGIQRSINIKPLNGSSQLLCTSFGNWKPNEEACRVDTIQLEESLRGVVMAFFALAAEHCSALCNHPWFKEWKSKILPILAAKARKRGRDSF
jgi:hypothetical protein